ncbi:hypothetical protein [Flavobacterium macrobrachii]|uniref:hypothetical protein n=1 Tax=Flavobacterium macrobrachii TaxID=591204 RepID=UPI0037C0CBF7
MKGKILLLLFVSISVLSCKNKEEAQEVQIEEKDNSFTITVDMVVKKDDNFQIYYMEDVNEPLDPKNYIDVAVKGSENSQEVVFKLPEDVVPANIRFDLGGNKEQEPIKINSFKMNYFDKKFEAKNEAFDFFFGYNQQVTFDKVSSTATMKTQGNEDYDPICIAKPSLHDELKKMVQ